MTTCFYKECYPPTGVTLCEAAYCTHPPAATTPNDAAAAGGGGGIGTLQQPNLVLVRTNRLEVYRLRSSAAAPTSATTTATTAAASAPAGSSATGAGARLELVASYHLHGVVESLAVLSGGTPRRRDALLLAFREGKLSVVEWDPRSHALRTSSLHYFEGDPAAQREGRAAVPLPPRVVTDPAGRCAAMTLYCAQLALLPALEADSLDLGAAGGGGGGGVVTVGNGYLLNLNKMMGIREVRDCVFLHGYTEPVLLLLHEPDPTWVGRLRERKDTCCLTAISISLRLKRHTILWKMASLPYDSYKLLAVPYRPAVLVVSPNLLMLCSQASHHAAALNSNALPGEVPPPLVFDPAREPPAATAARIAAEFALNVHPDCAPTAGRNATLIADLEAVAAGAAAAWMTPTTAIMGLQSGSLLAVHLQFEGPADQRITAVRTGGGPIAAAMVGVTMAAAARAPAAAGAAIGGGGAGGAAAAQAYLAYRGPKGFMFLGSWSGDSVLMQLRPRKPAAAVTAAAAGDEEEGGPGSSAGAGGGGKYLKDLKRGRGGNGAGGDDDGGGGDAATNRSAAVAAAAAAFAAAAAAADAAGTAPRYNLRVLDSLLSMGPVRDLLFADTSVSSYTAGSGGGPETSRGGPTCFACVGQGQTGAIVMARQGLIADVLTEVGLPAVAGVFAVYHRTEDDDGAEMAFDAATDGAAGSAAAAGPGVGDVGEGDGEVDDGDDGGGGGQRATVEMTPEPPEIDAVAAAAAADGGGGGSGGGGGGADVKMEEVSDGEKVSEQQQQQQQQLVDGVGTEADGSGDVTVKEEDDQLAAAAPPPGDDGAAAAADGIVAVAERSAPPSPSRKRSPGATAVSEAQAAAPAAAPPPPRPTGPPFHAYLLITLGRARTMVLRCTDGLDDVTNSPECEFLTDQPTLAAGNLFHNAVIVQACPMGLRVLEGMSLVQELPVTDFQALGPLAAARSAGAVAPTITYMQTADPYVLVGLSDGTAVLLEGDPLSLTLGVATAAAEQLLTAPSRGRQHRLAAACLHRDETGWMAVATASAAAAAAPSSQHGGDAGGDGSGGSVFLWICRKSGRLECYSLPYMRLVFQSSGLAGGEEVLRMGPAVMYDMFDLFGGGGGGDGADGGGEAADGGGGGGGGMEDPVAELRVESFRGGTSSSVHDCERPVLLALTASGSLLAYQAFNPSAGSSGQLPLRQHLLAEGLAAAVAVAATHGSSAAAPQLALCRLPLESLSHEAPAPVAVGGGGTAGGKAAGTATSTALGARLVRFDHLAYTDSSSKSHGPSYSGFFLCGSRPLWLVASRGGLVPHPMFVEGAVASMTAFHNTNCPLGFITACSSRGQLKVCQLPPHTRLDTPWVTHRVALRVTPHRLAWFRDAGLLAAITSRTVTSRPRPPEEPGGDAHASAAYAAAAAAASGRGREEAWELRLLEPSGCGRLWSSPLLPPGEQALCVRVVYLHNATRGDTDALLAVGTGCPMGEDYPCLGRILLYTISAEVVDLGAGNLTRRWNAVLVATRDMASAVTSVQEFKSQLLVSCGSRIEMYEWRGMQATTVAAGAGGGTAASAGGSLEKRAFFDLPCLVTDLVTVKDYLLASDAAQGLYFVRYSDANRVLEFMAKDFDHRDVLAAGVIINEPKLAFLAADAAGNLALSEFYGSRNTNPEFWAGQRLAPLGLLHVARRLGCCAPIKLPTGDGKNRHALLCGVAEGGLSYIAPVPDSDTAQRLLALQNHLSRALSHVAGLNPRAFRHRFSRIPKPLGGGESHHAPPPPRTNGLLDGQLLMGYPLLTRLQQAAAAEAVGTTTAVLLADLRAMVAAATLC